MLAGAKGVSSVRHIFDVVQLGFKSQLRTTYKRFNNFFLRVVKVV